MDDKKKEGRYLRIYAQLEVLLQTTDDPIARMASVSALLHHKLSHYFWTTVNTKAPVVVPDVYAFPGHIACDSRSKSEITIPVFDRTGKIRAVFDVDSDSYNSFSDIDRTNLEEIISLIFATTPFNHG